MAVGCHLYCGVGRRGGPHRDTGGVVLLFSANMSRMVNALQNVGALMALLTNFWHVMGRELGAYFTKEILGEETTLNFRVSHVCGRDGRDFPIFQRQQLCIEQRITFVAFISCVLDAEIDFGCINTSFVVCFIDAFSAIEKNMVVSLSTVLQKEDRIIPPCFIELIFAGVLGFDTTLTDNFLDNVCS